MKTTISNIYRASFETFHMLKEQEDNEERLFQCLEIGFQNLESND